MNRPKILLLIPLLLLLLLLLGNGRVPTEPIGDITEPTGGPASPTAVPNNQPTPQSAPAPQPDSLPPIGLPWAGGGVNDSGYCPLLYGHGWNGRLLWPVEGFTALRPFGYFPGGMHGGLDLTVPFGTPVYAPVSGRVVWSGGNSAGFGNQETGLLAIASSGRVILLAHLSGIVAWLDCGDRVTAGQLVGWSGGPGYGAASWNHLHLGVRWQGLDWNPMLWLG